MKKISAILVVILYSSCYKTHNTPLPNVPPTFTIGIGEGGLGSSSSGSITDGSLILTIRDSSSEDFDFSFSLTSGNPQNYPITCTIGDLPAGTSVSSDSFSFKLNFGTLVTISTSSDTGIYSFSVGIRTMNGLKTYPAKLHILPPADEAPGLIGTYSGNDPCGHFSIGDTWTAYSSTVATVPGSPHWISIKNFKGLGDSIVVLAFVTCTDINHPEDGSVDIPVQTTSGYTIFGRGTGYYGTQESGKPWISIYGDTIIHAGDTLTCYTQLKQ